MLPGFRFLLAAIVLSISVLVFALGAAALLRAAHEEFASAPAWRVAPEPTFARKNEPAREELMPVLAILRVEPEPAPPTVPDSVPAAAALAEPEPQATAPMPDQPENIAALAPQDETPAEAAKPDLVIPELTVQSEAPAADAPAPAEETRIAAVEQTLPPAHEAVIPAPEPAIMPPPADTDLIAAKIATLGGPPVAIETQQKAEAAGAKPDRSAARKRLQAQRAKERRAQRARAARQAAARQAAARQAAARQAAARQQPADPFAQPTITPRSR